MTHLSEEQIALYVIGARDAVAFDDVEQHLAACEGCSIEAEKQARLELQLPNIAKISACPSCQRSLLDNRCAHCGAASWAGPYRILRVLVQTPRGRLYLAESEDGEKVALKELVFTQVPSMQTVVAFEREGRLLGELRHPRIPHFVQSFTEGEGVSMRLYLAQEYVEGRSLLDKLQDHRFTEDEIADIARQVLQTLEYLQGLSPSVFHRDIKPANLVQRPDGTIVLVDFGAARDLGATVGATMAGTFGYSPPEQFVGIVDATSDLYALGAALSHLMSRRPPWQALEGGLSRAKMTISGSMLAFLQKLTAPKPAERYPNATAALEALGAMRKTSKLPWKRAAIVASIACAIGAGATALINRQERQPERIYAQPALPPPTAARPPVPPVAPVASVAPIAPVVALEGTLDIEWEGATVAFGKGTADVVVEPIGQVGVVGGGLLGVSAAKDGSLVIARAANGSPWLQMHPTDAAHDRGDENGSHQLIAFIHHHSFDVGPFTEYGGRFYYVVREAGAVFIESIGADGLASTRHGSLPVRPASIQVPSFDPKRIYYSKGQGVERGPLAGGAGATETWFKILRTDISIGRFLILGKDLVIAEVTKSEHNLARTETWIIQRRTARIAELLDGPIGWMAVDSHAGEIYRVADATGAIERITSSVFPSTRVPVARRPSKSKKLAPAVELEPGAGPKARSLAEKGSRALLEGDLPHAEKYLQACVALAALPECYRNLGVLYGHLSDTDKSVANYRQYLRLRPDAPDAQKIRVWVDDFELPANK